MNLGGTVNSSMHSQIATIATSRVVGKLENRKSGKLETLSRRAKWCTSNAHLDGHLYAPGCKILRLFSLTSFSDVSAAIFKVHYERGGQIKMTDLEESNTAPSADRVLPESWKTGKLEI